MSEPDAGETVALRTCGEDESCPYCRATCDEGTAGAGPRFWAINHSSSDIRGMAFREDGATAYVLVSDVSYGSGRDTRVEGAVFAVDMATGDRTVLSGRAIDNPDAAYGDQTSREVGAGPSLEATSAIVRGPDGAVYVHRKSSRLRDGSLEGDTGLIRVDPGTGERSWALQYADLPEPCRSQVAPGDLLVFDSSSGLFYSSNVRLGHGAVVLEFDLEGTQCRYVSTSPNDDSFALVGEGPNWSSMNTPAAITMGEGVVYVTYTVNGGLWAVDIATGDRDLLLDPSEEEDCFLVANLAYDGTRVWSSGNTGLDRASGGTCGRFADQIGWYDIASDSYVLVEDATGVVGRNSGPLVVHPTVSDAVMTANNQGLAVFHRGTRDSYYLSH